MSDSTALANIQAVTELWNSDQVKLIRDTIAPGISPSELGLFAMVCQRTGLDPFTKQIYAIKRSGRMTIQTGIDGYRLLAVRSGELAGIDDAIYDADDADHPGRASVTVWRLVQGQRVAFTATARWAEYVQDNSPMWKRMPYLMLGKCAESLALRKAFPAELSGIYTAEEMAQADNNDAPTPAHRVIEAEPNVAPAPPAMAQAARDAAAAAATAEKKEPFRTATPTQWDTIRRGCAALGKEAPEPPMSFEDAGALIGQLSEEYKQHVREQQKAGTGTGATR